MNAFNTHPSRLLSTMALAVGMAALALPVQAQIAQWNFNAGNTTPSIGSGTASLVGGTTATFASGSGSTDPTQPGFGWNTSSYPTQGTNEKTAGVRFNVSTLGLSQVRVSWDQRLSNTAANTAQFQFSTNGTTFTDFGTAFVGSPGDTWFTGRSIDLTGIAAVNNNANFAFRIVSAFGSPGNYVPATSTSTYGTGGTWRFDMVSVTAVPEPGTYALLLVGVAAVGWVARRRQG